MKTRFSSQTFLMLPIIISASFALVSSIMGRKMIMVECLRWKTSQVCMKSAYFDENRRIGFQEPQSGPFQQEVAVFGNRFREFLSSLKIW